MGQAERISSRPWLEAGSGLPAGAGPSLTMSAYMASLLGSVDWTPPVSLEEVPLEAGVDDGGSEPEPLWTPARYFGRERVGVGTAIRAVLGAAHADSTLALRLHAPLPLGRRPTILLDLAVNIVTAAERAATHPGAPAASPLNHAVDALGMADGYAEASAVRQNRRRWLGPGLLVAAGAAGEADCRWVELGFLAEAASRLAPCARAWQVARMPSRADALIDVVISLPGRLEELSFKAPNLRPARLLAEAANRALWLSLGTQGDGCQRLSELAAATCPERRERLLAFSASSSRFGGS